jgi:hypothetical protein
VPHETPTTPLLPQRRPPPTEASQREVTGLVRPVPRAPARRSGDRRATVVIGLGLFMLTLATFALASGEGCAGRRHEVGVDAPR